MNELWLDSDVTELRHFLSECAPLFSYRNRAYEQGSPTNYIACATNGAKCCFKFKSVREENREKPRVQIVDLSHNHWPHYDINYEQSVEFFKKELMQNPNVMSAIDRLIVAYVEDVQKKDIPDVIIRFTENVNFKVVPEVDGVLNASNDECDDAHLIQSTQLLDLTQTCPTTN